MIKTDIKQKKLSVSKEAAYIAITCALLVGGQFVFSFVAGVEVVTLILAGFSYVFGARRGVICAAVFSLLRCIIYGFYPAVVILYFIYYPLLATVFGLLGKGENSTLPLFKNEFLKVILVTAAGAAMTAVFTLLDDIITPLFFGLSHEAAFAYFYASLAVMLPQVICTVVTICTLFLPLTSVFKKAANL